jgi:hypothetical protein
LGLTGGTAAREHLWEGLIALELFVKVAAEGGVINIG